MPLDNLSPVPSRSPEAELLTSALWLIREPDRWCKRAFSRDRHRPEGGIVMQRCAVTAIQEAAYRDLSPIEPDFRLLLNRVYAAVADEIVISAYPQFMFWFMQMFRTERRTNRCKIMWFNDQRKTRHADVIRLFRQAIERLESEAAGTIDTKQLMFAL